MPSTIVRLTTQPARAISETRLGAGEVLHFEIVTGLRMPDSRPIAFRHFAHSDYALPGAPLQRSFYLSPDLSQRLMHFIRQCYVQGRLGYDTHTFAYYLAGWAPSPIDPWQPNPPLRSRRVSPPDILAGVPYVIGTADGEVLRSFMGLGPNLGLCITTRNGALGICKANDYMRVCGGSMLGRVFPPGSSPR